MFSSRVCKYTQMIICLSVESVTDAGQNPKTIIQYDTGQDPKTIIQYDAGQNPTL